LIPQELHVDFKVEAYGKSFVTCLCF